MDAAQRSYVLAVVLLIIALWCLVLATFAALHYHGVDAAAEAPIAAFSKTGDDRTLPPILSGLQKSRHFLRLFPAAASRPAHATMAPEPPPSPSPAAAVPDEVPDRGVPSDVKYATSAVSSARTPGLFVYGDSTVDVGNNNNLRTLAKAVFPPYGRDFDTHSPTGRFSNGRVSVDYLALYLRLPNYTLPFKPFKDAGSTPFPRALNFASAGAGILNSSGEDLGDRISLSAQVQNMFDVMEMQSRNVGIVATSAMIENAIHYISIGSNDFIHSYLRNVSSLPLSTADFEAAREFSLNLTRILAHAIEMLYASGARKVAVVGIGPLGCAPHYLSMTNLTGQACADSINFMVADFNSALKATVSSLAFKHRDLRIVNCDVLVTLLPVFRSPSTYGFRNGRMACCGAGRYGGAVMCLHPWMACNSANDYVWWDQFHPTDKVNKFIAEEIWSGNACKPLNLQQLAAL